MQHVTDVDAVAFDAYGTLFDLEGNWAAPEVVAAMREKQLQYSWQLSLMGEYRDFREVTRAAIEHTLEAFAIPGDVDEILGHQLAIMTFNEVHDAVERIAAGRRLFILSNGHPEALRVLVHNAGLEGRFEALVSADEVRIYKPSPAVYQLLLDRSRVSRERLLFVSSNAWDAAGAAAFGLRVAWVNRKGAPRERIGGTPELVVSDLADLARRLGA